MVATIVDATAARTWVDSSPAKLEGWANRDSDLTTTRRVFYSKLELLLLHRSAFEVKTPQDIYPQRHSPLSPDLWLHYSRLSARYISRHVPGADISLYPVS